MAVWKFIAITLGLSLAVSTYVNFGIRQEPFAHPWITILGFLGATAALTVIPGLIVVAWRTLEKQRDVSSVLPLVAGTAIFLVLVFSYVDAAFLINSVPS